VEWLGLVIRMGSEGTGKGVTEWEKRRREKKGRSLMKVGA